MSWLWSLESPFDFTKPCLNQREDIRAGSGRVVFKSGHSSGGRLIDSSKHLGKFEECRSSC